MNILREVFQLTNEHVIDAINMRYSYGTGGLPELQHAFSYTSWGWDAYGIVSLLLLYLNNGKEAVFSDGPFRRNAVSEDERDLLLAFLLAWLDDDTLS